MNSLWRISGSIDPGRLAAASIPVDIVFEQGVEVLGF